MPADIDRPRPSPVTSEVFPDPADYPRDLLGPALARRGMISTDIERWATRSALDQHEAQRAYEWAISRAAADAGLDRADWLRQPTGDGEFVILPEGVHEPRVIAVMLPVLATWLRGYNRSRVADCRVRLRVAVHHGLVHLDGVTGAAGPATVVVARLLNSRPVRDVLRQRPDTNLAAIISREVFEDVVVNRYHGLRPELFQHVQVQDRVKGFAAEAWIYAPEEDVTRPAPLGTNGAALASVTDLVGRGRRRDRRAGR
jgi:hypothetical protein